MSTPPDPQFLFAPSFPSGMVDEHGHLFDLRMPITTTESHPLCVQHRSISGNIPWHTDQPDHNIGTLESIHRPWNPSHVQPLEVLSTPYPINEGHDSYNMMPPPCPAYTLDQSSHAAFPGTLWPTSPDRQPLVPLVGHESSIVDPFLAQSSIHPFNGYSSHTTLPPYPSPERSISPIYSPYQSFSPISLHLTPNSTSTGLQETDPRSHLAFYRVSSRKRAMSSCRRCAAHAIEYDGLRIDDEELLKGMMEPGGKLAIHQCHWEANHSPCHLWIRGDEASINLHIQKWHGGKPGGDKLRVDCRWSACGKTMRKDSIARHIVSVHLGEVWECQGCGKGIVRGDAYRQHAARSNFDACRTFGALVTYSTNAREIDARVALECGVRLPYVRA